MVQPTKDRLRDNVSEPLDRARAGRVLPKRKVRPYLIIIAGVLRQKAPKVRFVEHDHMVGTLVARRPDQAFNMAVLPGRTEGRWPVPDAHRLDASLEDSAECPIIVPNEILGRCVPGERLRDLPRQPFGCWIAGHRKPQQLPPFVAENEKCKELLKRNRRDNEQIDRRKAFRMIVNEGLPGLQRPAPPGHHVDRNRGLGDIDAQLEQFAVDLGGAPPRVLETHSSNEVAHFLGDPRSATAPTGSPPPVSCKTQPVPTHDCFGSDDGYGVKDSRAATIEPDEQRAVDPAQIRSKWRVPLQDVKLMPQDQDFGFQPLLRLEAVAQHAEKQEADYNHSAIMF